MIDISSFRKISKDAKNAMLLNSNGDTINSHSHILWRYILFYILPYLCCLIILLYPNFINEECIVRFRNFEVLLKPIEIANIEGIVGTIISIFTGLFFSLLLGINDKIRNEKYNEDKDKDSFKRYKESMRQIASLILYIIQVGIEIFILLLLNLFFKKILPTYIENIFIAITVFLLIRYISLLLSVIQRFYYTTRDEIDGIL